MRVAAAAWAVTECLGHAYSDLHLARAHDYRAHAPRDHGDIEHRRGQAFKHHQDSKERHADRLGHLAKGDAHADRPRPDHDG